MTLRKQLGLWLLLIVAVMTMTAAWLGVRNAQHIVVQQLSQNIKQDIENSRDVFIQYILDVRGQQINASLKSILNKIHTLRVDDLELKTSVDSSTVKTLQRYPTWFTRTVNFDHLIVKQSLLVDNSGKTVELDILLNPDYAYKILWPYAKKIAWNYFLLGIVIYLVGLFSLYFILKPISLLIEHVKLIQHKDFHIHEKLPYPRDLREIAETLNHLTLKNQMMFDEHRELNQLMRTRAFQDSVTGLANRRFFDSRFEQILSATEAGMGGALFLVRVKEIQTYLKHWGYEQTNILLKHMASILSKLKKEHDIPVMCHFGDADFAIIFMNIDPPQIEAISKKILHEFNRMHQTIEGVNEPILAHIGIAQFTRDSYHHDIMRQADEAIRQAQEHHASHWLLSKEEEKSLRSIDWPQLLKEKLSDEEVFIQYQPVFFYENHGAILFHNEALMRLRGPKGERFPAGMLIPLMNKMELAEEYDKVIINLVLERVNDTVDGMQRYAINVSEQSIKNPEFIIWLMKRLASEEHLIHRINFEFAEYMVRDNIHQVKMFVESVRQLGIQVGLDHFGCGFSSFGYLNELKIDYVKIDGSYIRNVHQNIDNQVIVRSFVEICHGLDILVIATTVEIEEEREMLMSLHVDGMQGYFIGQPA